MEYKAKLTVEEHNDIIESIDGLIKKIEPFNSSESLSAIDDLSRVVKRITELYVSGFETNKPTNAE